MTERSIDDALVKAREAFRELVDAYVEVELMSADEAADRAAWYARKCAEYWVVDREAAR